MSVAWTDARNPVRVPDIGVNLALDQLQLVELVDYLGAIFHHNVVSLLERVRIAEAKGGAPSLVMISFAVRVIPQPSPLYVNCLMGRRLKRS